MAWKCEWSFPYVAIVYIILSSVVAASRFAIQHNFRWALRLLKQQHLMLAGYRSCVFNHMLLHFDLFLVKVDGLYNPYKATLRVSSFHSYFLFLSRFLFRFHLLFRVCFLFLSSSRSLSLVGYLQATKPPTYIHFPEDDVFMLDLIVATKCERQHLLIFWLEKLRTNQNGT